MQIPETGTVDLSLFPNTHPPAHQPNPTPCIKTKSTQAGWSIKTGSNLGECMGPITPLDWTAPSTWQLTPPQKKLLFGKIGKIPVGGPEENHVHKGRDKDFIFCENRGMFFAESFGIGMFNVLKLAFPPRLNKAQRIGVNILVVIDIACGSSPNWLLESRNLSQEMSNVLPNRAASPSPFQLNQPWFDAS